VEAFDRLRTLPRDERSELYRRVRRDAFRDSLYLTSKYLLGYTEIDAETHGKTINVLTDDSKRKLIVLPRGSFKSSLACEAFPVWRLLNDYNHRILIDSEVYTNSKNFLRKIRALLESEPVTELFGAFKTDHNWNEGEITIAKRTLPLKEASVTCSGVGAVKVSQHYDTIIMDDMNSPNNSATPEGRQKVIDHYKMSTSLLEPGGTLIVIGTRYAADDLPGWIIENELNEEGLL
jgi:hypothetical protein